VGPSYRVDDTRINGLAAYALYYCETDRLPMAWRRKVPIGIYIYRRRRRKMVRGYREVYKFFVRITTRISIHKSLNIYVRREITACRLTKLKIIVIEQHCINCYTYYYRFSDSTYEFKR